MHLRRPPGPDVLEIEEGLLGIAIGNAKGAHHATADAAKVTHTRAAQSNHVDRDTRGDRESSSARLWALVPVGKGQESRNPWTGTRGKTNLHA